jgi:hypothetical protein
MTDANKLRKIQDCKGRLKEIVGDEGVIQLAMDGICPHYVLTNPLTKEESIWFVPSELNYWFEENFIRFQQGNFTPNYQFTYFSKDDCLATGEIPDELHKIQDLYQIPIEHISTPPGIYFLCKGKKIQYIGQATNVASRIVTHIKEGLKDFDKVLFITSPIRRLTEVETALIRYFRPPLNKTCQVSATDRDKVIVASIIYEFEEIPT